MCFINHIHAFWLGADAEAHACESGQHDSKASCALPLRWCVLNFALMYVLWGICIVRKYTWRMLRTRALSSCNSNIDDYVTEDAYCKKTSAVASTNLKKRLIAGHDRVMRHMDAGQQVLRKSSTVCVCLYVLAENEKRNILCGRFWAYAPTTWMQARNVGMYVCTYACMYVYKCLIVEMFPSCVCIFVYVYTLRIPMRVDCGRTFISLPQVIGFTHVSEPPCRFCRSQMPSNTLVLTPWMIASHSTYIPQFWDKKRYDIWNSPKNWEQIWNMGIRSW